MVSYSKFTHIYNKSVYKYELDISKQFKVFLNGEEIPVYTCDISKHPFNTVWPGHQRAFDQTTKASYVNIVSDEAFDLTVEAEINNEKVMLKPYAKEIPFEINDNKISFSIKENGQYVLQIGSHMKTLYIFNNKPISAPKKDEVTYYFDAGIHFPGKITLKSNESVYVDKDAYVLGCIFSENSENIKIFGNGILDDGHEERTNINCYEAYTNGNLKFYDCKNIEINGVGIKNSAIWCLNIFGCENVSVDNLKIFGQWRYNTDGIDIVNSSDVKIINSFVHSFDDSITIKGIDRYDFYDNKNIYVDNCILWCDWGKCLEVGIETACKEYKNITFKNCHILKGGLVPLDISNGDYADISNVLFENINVDFNSFDTPEVYQENDDQKYTKENEMRIPVLIQIRNVEFRSEDAKKAWGIKDSQTNLAIENYKHTHNVEFNNINVYYDEKLPQPPEIKYCITNNNDDWKIYDVNISNIFVNKEKIDDNDLKNIDKKFGF